MDISIRTKQTDYWNNFAGKKEFTSEIDRDFFKENINQKSKILDYGCGYGRTILELKSIGYNNLVGVDISEQMLKLSQSQFSEFDFQLLIQQKTSFENDSFDAVLLLNTLTAITTEQEQNSTIKEISRLLKKGGYLYLTDFLLNDDQRNLDRYAKYENQYGIYGVFETDDGAILRHQNLTGLLNLLDDFEIISQMEKIVKTMNKNLSKAISIIAKKK